MAAQTRSLRRLYPKVKVANSLLESPSEVGSAFYGDATVSIDSEKEFQFDDVVTNSQAYRRVLIQNLKQERKEVGRFEEDLIDLDLILVDLSEEVETENEVKKGSFSNDLELLMVPTGKDDGEGENSGLDTPLVDDGKQNPIFDSCSQIKPNYDMLLQLDIRLTFPRWNDNSTSP
jgi:hypothetical protein